jgi:hypothetical protein
MTVGELVASQQVLLDDLLARAAGGLSSAERVGCVHELERLRRRFSALDHVLIAGLCEDITTGVVPARNARDFLVEALRLHPAQAAARVAASVDVGPRRDPVGLPLKPLFPALAAAQAQGVVSERHAAVIRKAITDLPAAVEAEHGEQAEQVLVRAAQTLNRSNYRKPRSGLWLICIPTVCNPRRLITNASAV